MSNKISAFRKKARRHVVPVLVPTLMGLALLRFPELAPIVSAAATGYIATFQTRRTADGDPHSVPAPIVPPRDRADCVTSDEFRPVLESHPLHADGNGDAERGTEVPAEAHGDSFGRRPIERLDRGRDGDVTRGGLS